MNRDVATTWVAALRSGSYAQGQMFLTARQPDADAPRHCCLGVLCELAVDAGVVAARWLDSPIGTTRRRAYGAQGATQFLPREVLVWAGLDPTRSSPYVVTDDPALRRDVSRQVTFVDLNDDRRLTFDEIADVIETALELTP